MERQGLRQCRGDRPSSRQNKIRVRPSYRGWRITQHFTQAGMDAGHHGIERQVIELKLQRRQLLEIIVFAHGVGFAIFGFFHDHIVAERRFGV